MFGGSCFVKQIPIDSDECVRLFLAACPIDQTGPLECSGATAKRPTGSPDPLSLSAVCLAHKSVLPAKLAPIERPISGCVMPRWRLVKLIVAQTLCPSAHGATH